MCSIDSIDKRVIPDELFHTVLTVTDYRSADTSNPSRRTFILGTHGKLKAAKSYAANLLGELTVIRGYFDDYEFRSDEEPSVGNWVHDNTTLVYADLPAGQVFTICIHNTPNTKSLAATTQGQLVLPGDAQFLHYILQTTMITDSPGFDQTTQIKGTYIHSADAWSAAHKLLDRTQYVKYNDRSDTEFQGYWPHDEKVVIHAVSNSGQNLYVSVRKPVWADAGEKKALVA